MDLNSPPNTFLAPESSTKPAKEDEAEVESPEIIKRTRLLGHILQWLHECDSNDSLCSTARIDEDIRGAPRFLVDVQNLCLTEYTSAHRYIALSYVWGQVPTFKTLQSNLTQLKEPKSLATVHLPRTIRDTIALLPHLDEQFLWVDSLCIVQDSDDLEPQIEEMAAIYAKAHFTIVPEQGHDADHGIRTFPAFGPITCGCDYHTCPSNWEKRGWTYQESYFSRRKITLGREFIRWACRCREYICRLWLDPEEIVRLDSGFMSVETDHLARIQKRDSNSWPNIRKYSTLAECFPRTTLTFPEDAMVAVSSILAVMMAMFDGDFLCCLPVLFLDAALLWKGSATLRMQPSVGSQKVVLPTWSWIAWEGWIRLDRSIYSYISQCKQNLDCIDSKWGPLTSEVESIVEWYSVDLEMKTKRKIGPRFQKHKLVNLSTVHPEADEIPDGWRALPCKEAICFVHDHHPALHFRYPIPLRSERVTDHDRSPYLFCRTRQGRFSIDHRLLDPKPEGWQSILMSVESENADGKIVIMNTAIGTVQPTVRLKGEKPYTFCGRQEFVAISAGSVAVGIDNRAANGGAELKRHYPELAFQLKHTGSIRPLDGEVIYRFINVLLVEWNGGVACRRGIGRIQRDIWEREAVKEIDLLLG